MNYYYISLNKPCKALIESRWFQLPFIASLNRCVGIIILLMIHLQEYASNKTEDVNVTVLDMKTGINEAKALVKHISCDFKCRFDAKAMLFK